MAEVYKAWDLRRQYHIALKVMREDLAEDLEFVRRFQREAQARASLSHENIVRFYSFEQQGQLAFIVMGYVQGTSLRGRIFDAGGKPLPLEEVMSIARQGCAALHYAHSENVLHRDVKPGNIMLEPGGCVLMTDFGIAKAADAATATTVMPGTPAYMSPEQCCSELLGVRADVYSLGIVVFEMLAGRRPFVGDTEATTGSTREKIRWEQIHAEPQPLRQFNPDLSSGVETVVMKALAKDRQGRWSDVLAFWQALASAAGEQAPAVAAALAPMPVRAAPAPAPAAVPSPAPRRVREPEPVPAHWPEAEPKPAIASAVAPVGAAPGTQPPARCAALPPRAWVVGGVMLAALVITAVALLSPPPPLPPTPIVLVAAQPTASVPTRTYATAATATWTSTPTSTHTPTATATQTPAPTSSATPISTATPSRRSTPTERPPQIAFFRANPGSIIRGQCTTLKWGGVTNDTAVRIDPGIGRVSTPDSRSVCPTTTYVMAATGPGGNATDSVTVTVQAGRPDLIVESIQFAPMPPVENSLNNVSITIRNIGNAPSGAFGWLWQTEADFFLSSTTGTPPGLDAGESKIVTVRWFPLDTHASLKVWACVNEGRIDPRVGNCLETEVRVVPSVD